MEVEGGIPPKDIRSRFCGPLNISLLFSRCITRRKSPSSTDEPQPEGADMLPLVLSALKEENEMEEEYRSLSPILQLPNDIVLSIFKYLPACSLCIITSVCHQWNSLSKANVLWYYLCLQRWNECLFTKYIDTPIENQGEGIWKMLFKEQIVRKKRMEVMRKNLTATMKVRQNECDIQYKVVLLGGPTVGKTNLLSRLTRDEFDSQSPPTVGIEFSTRMMEIDHKLVKCQLWDIGTSENNRSTKLLSSTYCRGAVGAFIVFDITKKSSFKKIGDYLSLWKESNSRPFAATSILVGNKADLYKKRRISTEDAQTFAQANHLDAYVEVSALNGANIEDALYELLSACYDKYLKTQNYGVK